VGRTEEARPPGDPARANGRRHRRHKTGPAALAGLFLSQL